MCQHLSNINRHEINFEDEAGKWKCHPWTLSQITRRLFLVWPANLASNRQEELEEHPGNSTNAVEGLVAIFVQYSMYVPS